MRSLSEHDLAETVDGLLHAETQVHDGGIDLTAAEVYTVDGPGRVDFGGGELEPADVSPHPTRWRSADDDYQWWHLDAGTHLIEHNESLSGERSVVLQPRDALLERGATHTVGRNYLKISGTQWCRNSLRTYVRQYHPSVIVEELPRLPLTVPDGGLRLKENARVSTVLARGR